MDENQNPLIELKSVNEGPFTYVVLSEIFDVSINSIAAGARIPPHRHEQDVYNQVLEGEMIVHHRGVPRAIRRGEWVFIPAHDEHAVEVDQPTTLLELWRK